MNRVCSGLVAGLAGTAWMTLIPYRGYGPDERTMPGEMVQRLTGVRVSSNLVHWAYGTGFGLVRAALPLRGFAATTVHFAVGMGMELAILSRLKLMRWTVPDLAADALHHAVYSIAAGWVYDRLNPS
ncbi:MAG TPA: hypothetical protein VGO93_25450 [Candidatus Xenobia bacterium]|jgi:hypothetical protein